MGAGDDGDGGERAAEGGECHRALHHLAAQCPKEGSNWGQRGGWWTRAPLVTAASSRRRFAVQLPFP